MALLSGLKSSHDVVKVGVLRAFSSRHGNGPLIPESVLWKEHLVEEHNSETRWQGKFRIGPFDMVAAEYGMQIF